MRAIVVVLVGVLAFACGKPSGNDGGSGGGAGGSGGSGGGTGGSGGGAGSACLVDTLDAGDDDGGVGTDFTCRGQPPGEGGQAELVITGKATRAGVNRTALPGVRLDLLDLSGNVLATATADDAGVYALTLDAGCAPVAGEVRATYPDPDAGFYLSYAVPEAPWRYDRGNLELVMFDRLAKSLVAAFASVTLVDGGAVLAMTVEDCAGKPVQDATVYTSGDAGIVRYVGASGIPTNQLSSTSANGQVVIFNLPGTSTEVTALWDGGVIGQRVVPIHSDAATGTNLKP